MDEVKNRFIKPDFKIHLPKRNGGKFQAFDTIDWRQYLPTPEGQKFVYDTDCCMTYSAMHIVETILNRLKEAGAIPKEIIDQCTALGYFDASGSFAFSVEFSAIMNGTDPNTGNGFDQVWQSFQNDGLLPKSDLNFTMVDAVKDPNQQLFWDDYFNKGRITQDMKDKAKKFNSFFIINYDWIIVQGINGTLMRVWNLVTGQKQADILRNALTKAPVHVALYPCPSWNTGAVSFCGNTSAAHGVELFAVNNDGSMPIFDQYNPFNKVLDLDYIIPYAVLPSVTVKTKPFYMFNNNLKFGDISKDVNMLQQCLIYLGYLNITNPTFYYGEITTQAVLKFQQAQGIIPTAEQNVGPKTRLALNNIFSR